MAISSSKVETHDATVLPLMSDVVFPVCAAELAKSIAPPRFVDHSLLHDALDPFGQWEHWAAQLGLSGQNWHKGPRLANATLLLQAALDGRGIALARAHIVAGEIAKKTLVRILPHVLPIEDAYWLVIANRRDRQATRSFSAWLRAEAEAASIEMPRICGLEKGETPQPILSASPIAFPSPARPLTERL
jgi:LysR family glycine cleavage system transcriptional activator